MEHLIYKIEFAPRTEEQLKIIPRHVQKLLFKRIEQLTTNPRPHNMEPLQGIEKGLYRIRQGDYRIVYLIEDDKLLILVLRVVHRKEVYKKKHSK